MHHNPLFNHNLLLKIANQLRFHDLLSLRAASRYLLHKLPVSDILRQRFIQHYKNNKKQES